MGSPVTGSPCYWRATRMKPGESTPALRAKLQNMETQLRRLGEKLRTSTVAISRSR